MSDKGHPKTSSLRWFDDGSIIKLSPSGASIRKDAFFTFIKAALLSFLVFLFLYLPDFTFDYSQRSPTFLKFFWIFILISLALISSTAVIVSLINAQVCLIDTKSRTLYLKKRSQDQAIPFRNISHVFIEKSLGWSPRSICIQVGEDQRYALKLFATDEELEIIKSHIEKLIK